MRVTYRRQDLGGGGHTQLTIWVDGKNVGTLTVGTGADEHFLDVMCNAIDRNFEAGKRSNDDQAGN